MSVEPANSCKISELESRVSELEYLRAMIALRNAGDEIKKLQGELHQAKQKIEKELAAVQNELSEHRQHKKNVSTIMARVVGAEWRGHVTDAACILERRLLIALRDDPSLALAHNGKEFCTRICPKLKARLAEGIYTDPLWLCRECPAGFDDRLAPAIAEAERIEGGNGERILDLD